MNARVLGRCAQEEECVFCFPVAERERGGQSVKEKSEYICDGWRERDCYKRQPLGKHTCEGDVAFCWYFLYLFTLFVSAKEA